MNTQTQTLKTTEKDGVLMIILNRPEALNALNQLLLSDLRQILEDIHLNPEIKGIILTGAGEKAFAAGADIKEFTGLDEHNARELAENGQKIFSLIENCPKPVIAAVNGFALGGGCELAMACHLRVAAPNAKFGQPEVNLGIIPGYGGTQRLTQLVGKGRALELMMTGDMVDAETALQIGLVNHLVGSHEELLPRCHKLLDKINSKAPLAITGVIESVNAFYGQGDGYKTEADCFGKCAATEDFMEGTNAFIEKRPPSFSGK